ncbi:hypothetical protein BJF91_24055 [Allorhizobium taibaishanense]|uniref:Anti-sigma factor NepR domain-containing protein n=1 Tax=Allorhizobium taibaishanense TaxID=887144 RepID=A0A1Q9ABS7_9HYPH|nr:hypothetical protein BJF91_24055 [Allorhizobium taibaishanense]
MRQEEAGGAPADMHGTISSKLRQFYNAVQDEGIPDRFMDLLERLDAAEKASGTVRDMKDNAR